MGMEFKNMTPFIITEKMKCLGINITIHIWNLYVEKCKTVIKEIKDK
jgi:hypothetical protein